MFLPLFSSKPFSSFVFIGWLCTPQQNATLDRIRRHRLACQMSIANQPPPLSVFRILTCLYTLPFQIILFLKDGKGERKNVLRCASFLPIWKVLLRFLFLAAISAIGASLRFLLRKTCGYSSILQAHCHSTTWPSILLQPPTSFPGKLEQVLLVKNNLWRSPKPVRWVAISLFAFITILSVFLFFTVTASNEQPMLAASLVSDIGMSNASRYMEDAISCVSP